jgi:hypothetical protein
VTRLSVARYPTFLPVGGESDPETDQDAAGPRLIRPTDEAGSRPSPSIADWYRRHETVPIPAMIPDSRREPTFGTFRPGLWGLAMIVDRYYPRDGAPGPPCRPTRWAAA